MFYLYAVMLLFANLVCLASVAVYLPGNWLMIGLTAIFVWWRSGSHPEIISTGVWFIIVGLALAGELVEFMAGPAVVRWSGAGRRAIMGTFIGGIAGAFVGTALIPIPILGSLLGLCVGASAGAIIGQEQETGGKGTLKVGLAAGLGSFGGTTLKLLCGVVIWLIIAIAVLVP